MVTPSASVVIGGPLKRRSQNAALKVGWKLHPGLEGARGASQQAQRMIAQPGAVACRQSGWCLGTKRRKGRKNEERDVKKREGSVGGR